MKDSFYKNISKGVWQKKKKRFATNFSFLGSGPKGPQDWDLGLEARIWASRLRYGPGGGGEGCEEEEEEEEKIPHMCESIGHRPLRGRCPASPSTSTTTYLSRARVPLTI